MAVRGTIPHSERTTNISYGANITPDPTLSSAKGRHSSSSSSSSTTSEMSPSKEPTGPIVDKSTSRSQDTTSVITTSAAVNTFNAYLGSSSKNTSTSSVTSQMAHSATSTTSNQSTDTPKMYSTNVNIHTTHEKNIPSKPLPMSLSTPSQDRNNDLGSKQNLYPNLGTSNKSTTQTNFNSGGNRLESYQVKAPKISSTQTNTAAPTTAKSVRKVRPQISKISPALEQKINADPYLCAGVFFHQLNTNQSDTIDNYIAHHDAKWSDQTFVRTAFSTKNKLTTHQGQAKKWDVIEQSLMSLLAQCTKVGSYSQRVDAMMRKTISNYGAQSKTDFMTLTYPDIAQCFATTIPVVIQHAVSLPSLMFNTATRGDAKAEKLKCILNYFQQVGQPGKNAEKENRIISFERRCIHKKVDWANSQRQLATIKLEVSKKIEEEHGTLHVDFANKKVGGGVLNEGSVMEEIMFAICPEMIVSRLFTEILDDDEVLVITGTEQYSNYKGYSRNFQFDGSCKPLDYKVDELGRSCSQAVIMDALHFKQHEVDTQFQENLINRELHKAYVAFVIPPGEPNIPISTGNWGCGAFNGDVELKFLIQWMAASETGRNLMTYHTIGDQNLSQAIQSVEIFFKQNSAIV
ncbi:Poly(ADP-ribose) glycohydrolase [Orchesella cincta]|uniref:Poly(ADP-ribose) glycohydrolase n=1 Tax=Orchesella cincta TaxID=48709 RepID=A0A1D2M2G4_ORCCI|nr:Poly(ADP-ribose) glycohydrolase [Orchesella cincta]